MDRTIFPIGTHCLPLLANQFDHPVQRQSLRVAEPKVCAIPSTIRIRFGLAFPSLASSGRCDRQTRVTFRPMSRLARFHSWPLGDLGAFRTSQHVCTLPFPSAIICLLASQSPPSTVFHLKETTNNNNNNLRSQRCLQREQRGQGFLDFSDLIVSNLVVMVTSRVITFDKRLPICWVIVISITK